MARSNKYTSLNLNDVFDKKLSTNTNNNHPATNNNPSTKSFSKTALSNSRIHGHMLVLTRPTPKPISIPNKPPQINQDKGSFVSSPSAPDQSKPNSQPGSISLRPQGTTGSGPPLTSHPLPSPVSPSPSPLKSDRFVPPHLRPGFVGKEEKPGPELGLGKGGSGSFKGKIEIRGQRPAVQPQGLDPIERRPKSGGGYEPVRKGRDLADLNRPCSSGTRPSSSG